MVVVVDINLVLVIQRSTLIIMLYMTLHNSSDADILRLKRPQKRRERIEAENEIMWFSRPPRQLRPQLRTESE
jgi:hypothetical protein